MKPLTVCYFGTYRDSYSRNQIMIAGLRASGVKVIACHVPLWHGVEDRVAVASGNWVGVSFIKRVFLAYKQLLQEHRKIANQYDVMVVGYPGQLDIFVGRLLTWLNRKPLVLDMFMSIYLIALERGISTQHSLSVRLLRLLEYIGCRLPDRLICDTAAYRDWHCQTHHLDPDRFRLVPTGVDDRVFQPVEGVERKDGPFRILYYGSFIPNHGVDIMLEAAHQLQARDDIQFEFIGTGPTRPLAEAQAKQHNLTNVSFIDWVDKEELPTKIADSDLCLGVFGVTPQSQMTVQNKIYEVLAMKKPIITGDSATIREAFQHQVHLYLIPRNCLSSLVDAILTLHTNPLLCTHMAENGYQHVMGRFTIAPLGRRFKAHLEDLEGV